MKPHPSTADDAWLRLLEQWRQEYLAKARRVALRLGKKGGLVTVDDVRKHCPPPPEIDPRVMGAIFKTDDWELVGYSASSRTTCHRRPIAFFRLRKFI